MHWKAAVAGAVLLSLAAAGALRPARAADAPPAPRSADEIAALASADEAAKRAADLEGRGQYADAVGPAREALEIRTRVLGSEHEDTVAILAKLGFLLRTVGPYDEAEEVLKRALEIRERLLPPERPEIASSQNDLAALYASTGRFSEAKPLFERAIAGWSKARGLEDPSVAVALANLAITCRQSGDLAAARAHAERSLAIREKALAPDHPLVAASLDILATVRSREGDLQSAKRLFERALAIREKSLGPDRPEVGANLMNLGTIEGDLAQYEIAQPRLERALSILERSLGPTHPMVGATLVNLGNVVMARGRSEDAVRHFERALVIDEKVLGGRHPTVAKILGSLGNARADLGEYEAAKVLIERALAIERESPADTDPSDVAHNLNNLALVLRDLGRLEEAVPLLEQALVVYEGTLGRDHIEAAGTLHNLAMILAALGRADAALPLYERALAIEEKVLGAAHPDVAMTLSNLAFLHVDAGEPQEARPLLERALEIVTKALGEGHPRVASALLDLSIVVKDADLDVARALLERALAIEGKALGPEHPHVATTMSQLGVVLASLGRLPEAIARHTAAVAIHEKALGAEHPQVARAMIARAGALLAAGRADEAREAYAEGLRRLEAYARRTMAWMPPRERVEFVRRSREMLDAWVVDAPRLGRTGYQEVLRHKGLASELDATERRVSRHGRPETKAAAAALAVAQRRLARLSNERPAFDVTPAAREQWQKKLSEAAAEAERLSATLSRSLAAPGDASAREPAAAASLEAVRARLAEGEALVDFLRLADRYVAWVVRPSGDVTRVDLGGADAIDAAADEFRGACKDADAIEDVTLRDTGRRVRDLVVTPLLAAIGPATRTLCLAPDGGLASLPFACLPSAKGEGRLLIDDFLLVHVAGARDLIPDAAASGVGALVVGEVAYAARADAAAPSDVRGTARARFTPLAATSEEIRAISSRLGDGVTVLKGREATEQRIRTASTGKRFVHLATHGFVRDDVASGLARRKGETRWLGGALESRLSGYDPMALAGLALAGANDPPRGDDDGILTALEASTLDLDGCDLVSLSACETARGRAESGEGVLGLVRGFRLAGARRVAASLWEVDDEATRRLMTRFYDGMLRAEKPLAPAEALREAAVWLRQQKKDSGSSFGAPRYWAAFVLYGR